jgi:hypothetical protein
VSDSKHIGKLVYVASPYSSHDPVVVEARNLGVAFAMGYLMNTYDDYSFYSPICHTHPIATHCKLPGDWAFWKRFDETMLSRCEELWVFCMEGWRQSTGVTAEIAIAEELSLPIKYLHRLPGLDTYALAYEEKGL